MICRHNPGNFAESGKPPTDLPFLSFFASGYRLKLKSLQHSLVDRVSDHLITGRENVLFKQAGKTVDFFALNPLGTIQA